MLYIYIYCIYKYFLWNKKFSDMNVSKLRWAAVTCCYCPLPLKHRFHLFCQWLSALAGFEKTATIFTPDHVFMPKSLRLVLIFGCLLSLYQEMFVEMRKVSFTNDSMKPVFEMKVTSSADFFYKILTWRRVKKHNQEIILNKFISWLFISA